MPNPLLVRRPDRHLLGLRREPRQHIHCTLRLPRNAAVQWYCANARQASAAAVSAVPQDENVSAHTYSGLFTWTAGGGGSWQHHS